MTQLTFREALRGFLGRGPDHAAGFDDGRGRGGAVTFRAVATIDDLDAFGVAPTRPIALAGAIDYGPLGSELPLRGAQLELFARRDGELRFLYRLPFEASGRSYVLLGEKRLGSLATPTRLTTLYATLYETSVGADTPVSDPLARGILRVPLAEALRFPFAVRVAGRGALGSLWPALRFLVICEGELLGLRRHAPRGEHAAG
jgi:hypothetical protein